jgi:hypothetical protein
VTALISPCGKYRYTLERLTNPPQPGTPTPLRTILWVMLNPSTADAREDDATIRRCKEFSRRWGFGHMLVGNLFAYRATDPKQMLLAQANGVDILGPETNQTLIEMAKRSEEIILAWGANAERWPKRAEWVAKEMGKHAALFALGFTASGQPIHPVRQSYSRELQPWAP